MKVCIDRAAARLKWRGCATLCLTTKFMFPPFLRPFLGSENRTGPAGRTDRTANRWHRRLGLAGETGSVVTAEPARNRPVGPDRDSAAKNPRGSKFSQLNHKTLTTPFTLPPPPAVAATVGRGGRRRLRHASLSHKSPCKTDACSHRTAPCKAQASRRASTAVCSSLQVCLLAVVDNQDVDAGENLPPSANPPASNDTPNASTPDPVDSNESQS
ncbi:hypothetical protein PIB30_043139 [Stylosanthes scabra]|uniref:Uncharacterized protein n=1 Tax=Stylosanthes scabra TaxID=79078 RepID=A0ABU6XDK5_9FABA|nr:hypothetical protein [Stylosanthes scabra]